MTDPDATPRPAGEKIPTGFLREIGLVVRFRKLVLTNVIVLTLAAVAFSLLTPEIFEAHTSLLPAEESGSPFGDLTQLLRDLPFQGANLPGVTTSSDLLGAFLQSRRIQEPVIHELDLFPVLKAENIDEALQTFADRLKVSVSDEGILHVWYRDRERERAARVLNRLVEELAHYNLNVRVTRSRLNREFIEGRLKETATTLAEAEDTLRTYQEEHAVALAPEEKSHAESVASLLARKFALLVEMEAIAQFMDKSSPAYTKRLVELRALEHEIGNLPQLGMEVVRLYRDVKVQEELYLLLTSQLEQAVIEEHRDLPVFQTLDTPQPPELRAWPKRKLIVAATFILSVFVSLLLCHLLDFIHRERETLRRLGAPAAS